MAEWSNAAVLKTVDCNRSGGSNPSLSASSFTASVRSPPLHLLSLKCFLNEETSESGDLAVFDTVNESKEKVIPLEMDARISRVLIKEIYPAKVEVQ